jgi:hypothetical protein
MHRLYGMSLWSLVAFLVLCPLPVQATDLNKIDRTIGKEPAYKGKPKYCLVVFGPAAKSRVWLVRDGEVLYVDRNGDGDFTGKDKCVPKEILQRGTVFQIGTIPARDGVGPFSLDLRITAGVDKEDGYELWCGPPEGKHFDRRTVGMLLFADKPGEAPVIHFAGPLTLTILDWHKPLQADKLVRGGEDNELSILVGTPVLGGKHKAFVTLDDSFLRLAPDAGCPVVEVEFPGREPGAKPIIVRAKMRH